MSILAWEEPPRAMTQEEWESVTADGAPPGVYAPNMSQDWAQRWKARLAGQRTPGELRVEVRKTVTSPGTGRTHRENPGNRLPAHAQALILIYADGEVRVSANGPMAFSPQDWRDLATAVTEARAALAAYQKGRH